MRGSYNAKLVESDIIREQRNKEHVLRKKFRIQKCSKCKNRVKPEICHITRDIEGNLKCVFYED